MVARHDVVQRPTVDIGPSLELGRMGERQCVRATGDRDRERELDTAIFKNEHARKEYLGQCNDTHMRNNPTEYGSAAAHRKKVGDTTLDTTIQMTTDASLTNKNAENIMCVSTFAVNQATGKAMSASQHTTPSRYTTLDSQSMFCASLH